MTATALIFACFIGIAYLMGSVSFAVVVSKVLRLPDPRSYGSANPGATNVLRTGSKAAALLTLFGDACKGGLAVWLANYFGPRYGLGNGTVAAVAVAVFLGHLYPLFHRFQGGKGVATAAGILFALSLSLGLSVMFLWLLTFYFFRVSSVAAIAAAIFSPALAVHYFGFGVIALAVLCMALLLLLRHRSNIYKLIEGSEGRIGKP